VKRPSGAIGAAAVGTGAALAAGVASACCVGPALAPIFLTVLGSSGLIALSTLRPYAPYMLAGSALLLAFSVRQAYRKTTCAPAAAPAQVSLGVRIARATVCIAIALWIMSAAYAVYGFLNE
jgi:hypothetical protein